MLSGREIKQGKAKSHYDASELRSLSRQFEKPEQSSPALKNQAQPMTTTLIGFKHLEKPSKAALPFKMASFTLNESLNIKRSFALGKRISPNYLHFLERRTKSLDKREMLLQKSGLKKILSLSDFLQSVKSSISTKKAPKREKNMDIFAEFHPPDKSYDKLMQAFYNKKLSRSKYLLKYFEGKDIEKLVVSIGSSMYSILKESSENFITKEKLKNIHKTLNITHEDYDLYKGLFGMTMRELGYSEDLIAFCANGLERVRNYIVEHQSYKDIFGSEKEMNAIMGEIKLKINGNLLLQAYFGRIDPEHVEIHHKKMINMIFGNVPFLNEDHCGIYRSYHSKFELTYFEFFELKNIFANALINAYNSQFKHPRDYPLILPKQLECVLNNIEKLRPLVLIDPIRLIEHKIDIREMSLRFSKEIMENSILPEIFQSWSMERLRKHSESLLKYTLRHSSNKYFECDLIPVHCRTSIKKSHFSEMLNVMNVLLIEFAFSEEHRSRAVQNLRAVKHHVCKQKPFFDEIGGSAFLSPFIDHTYVHLFGEPLTKNLFLNAEADYVKYKQKLFFCRLFRNQVSSNDFDDLRSIHERLKITKHQFEIMLKAMQDYMDNIQFPVEQKAEILGQIRSLERYIVAKPVKKTQENSKFYK